MRATGTQRHKRGTGFRRICRMTLEPPASRRYQRRRANFHCVAASTGVSTPRGRVHSMSFTAKPRVEGHVFVAAMSYTPRCGVETRLSREPLLLHIC